VPEILLVTVIAAAVDECFELALSVDAHTASMGTSREIAVAGVTSGAMSLGETVTWEARHFGLPFRMTSKITAYTVLMVSSMSSRAVRSPCGGTSTSSRERTRGRP
jgi:hypothetical protein